MKVHECEFGDCVNTAELEQSFDNQKIMICPTCRAKAFQLVARYLKKISNARTVFTIEFLEALKKGGV